MRAGAAAISGRMKAVVRRMAPPVTRPAINRRQLAWMTLLTLLALALRAADMMGRSLWLDDGVTLLRLASSWSDNLRNIVYLYDVPTIDTHPPLYFLLLKAWVIFAGQSEFALKWVSVLAGVIVVPLTYALARRLFSTPVAILAAITVLLSPAIQWYSHDIRMYTLVVALSTLTTYAMCRLIKPRSTDRWIRRRLHAWIAWGILTFLSISTHYSFAGLALVHLAFIGIMLLRRMSLESEAVRRRLIRQMAVAGVVALAISAAIFPFVQTPLARLVTGREADYYFVPLDVIVSSIVAGHTFGMNATDPTGGLVLWGFVVLCVAGALAPSNGAPDDRQSQLDRLLPGLSTAGPVLVWFGLSFIKPNFQGVRHLILVLPFVAIILSRAMVLALDAGRRYLLASSHARGWAWTAGGIAGIAALLVVQGYGNLRQFVRTADWHDDWRGLAHYVRDNWQEGDVLVFGSPLEAATISLYAPDLAKATPPARDLVQQYRRVWLTNPTITRLGADHVSYEWLLENGLRRKQVYFPARTRFIELQLFELQSAVYEQLPLSARPLSNPAPAGLPALIGYEIKPGNPRNPQPNLWLSLYWRSGGRRDLKDYAVSLRFSDANGQFWHDWFALTGLESMPADLNADAIFRVDYLIPVPLGLPFQTYRLQFATHSGPKAEIAQVAEVDLMPDEVRCCVRVLRWPAASDSPPVWVGDGITLLKVEHKPAVYAGEILPVVLTWRLDKPTNRPWRTVLSFSGLLGGSVVTSTGVTGDGLTPIGAWPAGEPVRDMQSLPLPFTIRSGLYNLRMELYADDGRVIGGAQLGMVEVRDYPPTPVTTDIPYRVDAQVGELRLLGYALSQTPARSTLLDLYTYWQVESDVTRDGVLFLHVISPDGRLVAQDDNPPEYGKRSTLTYRPGDGIAQLHRFALPFDLPGGEYKLYAGIYNRSDIVRWPAFQDGAPARDDLIYLGSFDLPPLHTLYLPVVRSESK